MKRRPLTKPDPATRHAPMSAITDAARRPRAVWRSPRAYMLATVAGIVGLGNIWRFPYMVGRHGGGSFLVAYIVCVVVLALPLAALESAAGSLGRRSPVGTFRRAAGSGGAVIGWAVIATAVVILSYYLVVTGWTLGYAVDSYRGSLRTFGDFTKGYASLWWFFVVGVVCFVVLQRGVAAIERASLLLVPVLVLVVVGLAVYGQSLDGAQQARAFYFGVSASALAEPATWQAAAGQAFYSIGVGQGVLITYGSFVPAGTNLLRSTATIALTNSIVSVVAGLMVLSVAFSFDIAPTTGSELSFTAFPRVFAEVPGGAALGVVFFSLLFLAGFTSCLGAFVVIVSTARDELGLPARAATAIAVCGVVALGVPSALSFTDVSLEVGGEPFLDRVDQLTGSGIIVVLGMLGAAVLARRLPRRVLTAAFGADTVRFGQMRIGAGVVLGWAMVLPIIAAASYVAGLVLAR